MMKRRFFALLVLMSGAVSGADGLLGYYRHPALHGETIVFQAEEDLWKVSSVGGVAQRLTTHLARESSPVLSPDGTLIAFVASYEGPPEIYTMPVVGGKPTRITHEGVSGRGAPYPVSWKSGSELVYATRFFARRDVPQLAVVDLMGGATSVIPLEQASDGCFGRGGQTLYFTRLPRQSSFAKRYTGGLVENLWAYGQGAEEAVPLTADYRGTSRSPMPWKNRLYFASDRDGTMNLWSMDLQGGDLEQHTTFAGWDVLEPSQHGGRIVFRHQADLWLYDIEKGRAGMIPIRLASDFDHTRERWIEDPEKQMNGYALSHDGSKVGLTVRGRSFVAPVEQGRLVSLPHLPASRQKQVCFLPGSEDLLLLSDQSGEFEFWRHATNGLRGPKQVTSGAGTMLYGGIPSPDGRFLAYTDRDQILWLLELATGKSREVDRSSDGNLWDAVQLVWSPDSRWMAYVDTAENTVEQIHLYDTQGAGVPVPVTTDRLDSFSPAFSRDGKWLYFLSDREFRSVQRSPWGARQPEPYLDRTTRIYLLDLVGGQRSPFAEPNELVEDKDGKGDDKDGEEEQKEEVDVDWQGLAGRLHVVPLDAGNYRQLSVTAKHLYVLRSPLDLKRRNDLVSYPILRDKDELEAKTVLGDVRGYLLSGDGKSVLVKKDDALYVFAAKGGAPGELGKAKVDLSALALKVSPEDEWRQIFVDAWRMHRDYFYDPEMHGVDWVAVRKKHEALLSRVTNRDELNDLIGQMVGELSAMHTDIRAGDVRRGTEGAERGYLGARLSRVERGHRVDHIYRTDPDYPESVSPLRRPDADVKEGEVIVSVDGVATASVAGLGELLQMKAGRPVLLELWNPGAEELRKIIVRPLSARGFRSLKLAEWEYTRRLETEDEGEGRIGYFHMNAMTASNYAEFVKGYYPVYQRDGLIIDVRQNYGGNIDSWILGRLSRSSWMYWKTRTGQPFGNMHYAFNGHMVVLIDAYTISDGEAFAEGFRRLGLGPLVGTRTWGGGIWLRGNTSLVDGGMARSPETGVYDLSQAWIIEGGGVEPDIRVDNLPHQTYLGQDAQLEAAIAYLKKKIAEEPPLRPAAPERPDKSFDYPKAE